LFPYQQKIFLAVATYYTCALNRRRWILASFPPFSFFLVGGGRGVEDSAKDNDQVVKLGNPLGRSCGLSGFDDISYIRELYLKKEKKKTKQTMKTIFRNTLCICIERCQTLPHIEVK